MDNSNSRVKIGVFVTLIVVMIVALIALFMGYQSYGDKEDILKGYEIVALVDNVKVGTDGIPYYSIRVYNSSGDVMYIDMKTADFTANYTVRDHVPLLVSRSNSEFFVSKDKVSKVKNVYSICGIILSLSIVACIILIYLMSTKWDNLTVKAEEPSQNNVNTRSNRQRPYRDEDDYSSYDGYEDFGDYEVYDTPRRQHPQRGSVTNRVTRPVSQEMDISLDIASRARNMVSPKYNEVTDFSPDRNTLGAIALIKSAKAQEVNMGASAVSEDSDNESVRRRVVTVRKATKPTNVDEDFFDL